MTDDEIVEVLARAAYESEKPFVWSVTTDDEDRKIVRDAMRAALAALRKEGCEVVVWRPIADWQQRVQPKPPSAQHVFAPYDTQEATHFALVTGPESNNG